MYFKKLLKTNLQSLNCFIEMINIKLLVKIKIQPDKKQQNYFFKTTLFFNPKTPKQNNQKPLFFLPTQNHFRRNDLHFKKQKMRSKKRS